MKFAYKNMKVMVVSPLPTALDTLQECLKEFDFYRIWTAKNYQEALDTLKEYETDLVICSWKMQPQSGLQVLQHIRSNPKVSSIPVLMLVEKSDKHLIETGNKEGATDFIYQPIRSKDVVKAVNKALEELVDEDEETYLEAIHEAREASKKGKHKQVIEAYDKALAIRKEEDAMFGKARALKALGRLDEATAAYMETMKAHPTSLRAYMGLAEIYQGMERVDDAIKVLHAAVKTARRLKSDKHVEAGLLFYIGELEMHLRRLGQALGYFQEAVELTPEDTKLQTEIGDSLCDHGHYNEAEKFYEGALAQNPALAHVYNRLGIAYRKQEKYELAVTLYQKALSFQPEDDHLLFNISLSYWHMGNFERALEHIEKALKIDPNFKEGKAMQAACLKKLQQSE